MAQPRTIIEVASKLILTTRLSLTLSEPCLSPRFHLPLKFSTGTKSFPPGTSTLVALTLSVICLGVELCEQFIERAQCAALFLSLNVLGRFNNFPVTFND